MSFFERQFRDFVELETALKSDSGVDSQVIQLSGGRLDCRWTHVVLSGVSVNFSSTMARTRLTEVASHGGLNIAFVTASEKPVTCGGIELDRGLAQVWTAGSEIDMVLENMKAAIEIVVDDWLVEDLGWQCKGRAVQHVGGDRLARLSQACLSALHLARSGEPVGRRLIAARNRILDRLEPVLTPWNDGPMNPQVLGSRYYAYLRRAEVLFEDCSMDSSVAMSELAQSMGIHNRTLLRAFRISLGLSPSQYFRIVRLHNSRRALLDRSKETTVAKVAAENGFTEFGRFAANYTAHFGELPSQTLKRTP